MPAATVPVRVPVPAKLSVPVPSLNVPELPQVPVVLPEVCATVTLKIEFRVTPCESPTIVPE